MSLRIELFPSADSDLERQYDWYIEQADLQVAERYLKAFDASVIALAQHPGLGIARRFKSPSLASLHSYALGKPFDKHLIFYRSSSSMLSVVRVIHGARDLPRRLME